MMDKVSSPANPQEAKRQSILQCIDSYIHAYQCRHANCQVSWCQKAKKVLQHAWNCTKLKINCLICKHFFQLIAFHAKQCQQLKCLVPFCADIKRKIQTQELHEFQQRLQQAQLLHRRMTVMARTATNPAFQSGVAEPGPPPPGAPMITAGGNPGAMSPNHTVPSSVSSSSGGINSAYQQGIAMKPGGHSPSPNVIQVVKQVQAEAAQQQVPHEGGFRKVAPAPQMPPTVIQRHMGAVPNQPQKCVGIPMGGGPVDDNNFLSMDQWGNNRYLNNTNQPNSGPPNQNQVMQQNPMQQQNLMGMVGAGPSNQMGGAMSVGGDMGPTGGQVGTSTSNGPQLNTQQLSQILQNIKNNTSSEDHHQILQMLNSNPHVMTDIIKQSQERHSRSGRGVAALNQVQNNQWYTSMQMSQMQMPSCRAHPYPQRPRAPQIGGFQGGGVQFSGNPHVMSPPTQLQQQLMHGWSPPPGPSPQPTPQHSSPSLEINPSVPPRAQLYPDNMTRHSPVPHPGDMHNHMQPQSPLPEVPHDEEGGVVRPGRDASSMTAEDHLRIFVEQL